MLQARTGKVFYLPIDMKISKPDSSLNKRKWAQNIMRKKRISTSKQNSLSDINVLFNCYRKTP